MKTVFVADDDQLMREVLARTLQHRGLRARTFASAQALLARFEFEFPQLILSDVQMPGMTGLELLEHLRQSGSEVPVILMSAHLTPEIEARAKAFSAGGLIAKPIKAIDRLADDIVAIVGNGAAVRADSRLDEVRASFLMDLAHELRTPLTAIKIALDSLFVRRGDSLAPEERKMADIGRRNVDRIIKTVEDRLETLPQQLNRQVESVEEPESSETVDGPEKDLEPVR